MGCFDAVVRARPMLDEEGDGIRLGQGGSEWDEALCNVYEIGTDGPARSSNNAMPRHQVFPFSSQQVGCLQTQVSTC